MTISDPERGRQRFAEQLAHAPELPRIHVPRTDALRSALARARETPLDEQAFREMLRAEIVGVGGADLVTIEHEIATAWEYALPTDGSDRAAYTRARGIVALEYALDPDALTPLRPGGELGELVEDQGDEHEKRWRRRVRQVSRALDAARDKQIAAHVAAARERAA